MQDVLFEHTLMNVGDGTKEGYLCHAYCHEGECRFSFNGKEYVMTGGSCLIVRRSELLKDIRESSDFKVDVAYVTPQFITISTPQSNYGIRGGLSLFNNPIMHLTPEMQEVCALDFDYIRETSCVVFLFGTNPLMFFPSNRTLLNGENGF